MKCSTISNALLLGLGYLQVSAAQNATANIRALFLFKDVMKSNTASIKSSGFNSLIMFGVGVLGNGSIMYYSNTAGSKDVMIANGGAYSGGDALAAKVRSFKEGNDTGVNRLEVSMNSQHVKDLMASPGPVASSPLYKNFAALKAAWTLDGVNNDDESLYDVASTVSFAKMLGAIGYKYTISPYTNTGFWSSLTKQANSGTGDSPLIDRTYLQCYDGGDGNNPRSWQTTVGMKVVPLLWVTNDSKASQGKTVAQARSLFSSYTKSSLAGGGYWNDYDIEKMGLSYKQYGDVLTSLFP